MNQQLDENTAKIEQGYGAWIVIWRHTQNWWTCTCWWPALTAETGVIIVPSHTQKRSDPSGYAGDNGVNEVI